MFINHRRCAMRRSLRLIAALLVVGAVGFGASAAFATTGSSTAGSLSFSVSLPDTVTKGQIASWSGSITNNSQSWQDARVQINFSGPGVNRNSAYMTRLAPGQTLNRGNTYAVP